MAWCEKILFSLHPFKITTFEIRKSKRQMQTDGEINTEGSQQIEEKLKIKIKAMDNQGIRWQQRFSNYKKALSQLEKAVDLARERDLSDIEQQGLLKAFEFTHELAWNVIKYFFEYQGNVSIKGSRMPYGRLLQTA